MFLVFSGYQGLIENNIKVLSNKDVGKTIHVGGTILKTARSDEFRSKSGRDKAFSILKNKIDGLIVLGGDGSLTGAKIFYEENNFPIIGILVQLIMIYMVQIIALVLHQLEKLSWILVDKIRYCSISRKNFYSGSNGKRIGFLALESGVAAGAEMIIIPENKKNLNDVISDIKNNEEKVYYYNLR